MSHMVKHTLPMNTTNSGGQALKSSQPLDFDQTGIYTSLRGVAGKKGLNFGDHDLIFQGHNSTLNVSVFDKSLLRPIS